MTERELGQIKTAVGCSCTCQFILVKPVLGRMFLREPSWKYSAKLVGS